MNYSSDICTMRSVLYTLQRLQEQEKKQRQIELAEAQQQQQAQVEYVEKMKSQLQRERHFLPRTAGEIALQDRFLANQFYAVKQSEEVLQTRDEQVEICQETLLQARQTVKVTERLIETLEEREALEKKRKQDKETNDLGVMAWWRHHGLGSEV